MTTPRTIEDIQREIAALENASGYYVFPGLQVPCLDRMHGPFCCDGKGWTASRDVLDYLAAVAETPCVEEWGELVPLARLRIRKWPDGLHVHLSTDNDDPICFDGAAPILGDAIMRALEKAMLKEKPT